LKTDCTFFACSWK